MVFCILQGSTPSESNAQQTVYLELARGDMCGIEQLRYRGTTAADEKQFLTSPTPRSESGHRMVHDAMTRLMCIDTLIDIPSNGTTCGPDWWFSGRFYIVEMFRV